MRSELVEALVRMAVKRYIPHEIQDVSDACDNLMTHIFSTVPPEARVDPDIFRETRFYFEDLEKLFQRHGKALKVVFEYYENQNAVAGRAKFGLDDAVNLMQDARMIGDHVSMVRHALENRDRLVLTNGLIAERSPALLVHEQNACDRRGEDATQVYQP